MLKSYFPYYKRLITLAVPVVLTQAGQMIVGLVDNAMVGRVGTPQLAAASFANSVFMIIMMLGMGIMFGLTPLLGEAMGAKNEKGAASIIKNGHVLTWILAVLLLCITWATSWFMPYMGQTDEVLQYAVPYYRILCVSLIPFMLFLFLKQVGEGLGNTMVAMVATIVSNLINVGFNYLLIFGKMGFPELGLNGAGYATLISRIALPFILYGGFILNSRIRLYLKKQKESKVSREVSWQLLKTGFPIAIQMVLEVSLFAVGAVMVGWIDDVSLAAHQIAIGVAGFTFMIANGVAMATTIRVSVQKGDNNIEGLKMASYASIHLVMLYMVFTAIGFFTLRHDLPKIFTTDVEVIEMAASLFIVAGFFQLFDGLQVISLGILRGIADVKIPMYIAALSYVILGIPVSYFFAFTFGFGAMGIWFGFLAGLGLTSLLLFWRIKYMWKYHL